MPLRIGEEIQKMPWGREVREAVNGYRLAMKTVNG
jgi:hypothetical protein